jgi:glycosyltransferase involved in cell wall biosynthesis
VICFNEKRNIAECLASLRWVDEIIVVDSFSADETVAIVRLYTDKVHQRKWSGINDQRNYALSLARHDWVLSVDADERVGSALQLEIESALQDVPADVSGFYMPRLTFYLGSWIRHGGWYPDWKLRLFRKSVAHYAGEDPHDNVSLSAGRTLRLRSDLLHFTYRSFSDQLRRIDSFSTTGARRIAAAGGRSGFLPMLLHPVGKFLGTYLFRGGFLDGLAGFIISVASAFYVFARHVKLWEATRKKEKTKTGKIRMVPG